MQATFLYTLIRTWDQYGSWDYKLIPLKEWKNRVLVKWLFEIYLYFIVTTGDNGFLITIVLMRGKLRPLLF